MSKTEAYSVFVRFRPTNEIEKDTGGGDSYSLILEKEVAIDDRNFIFDRVYGPYETIGKQHVEKALDGYNTTIFAYGQTGSGKTYSMEGLDINSDDEEKMGLIPRIFAEFERKQGKNLESGYDLTFNISMVEIYNEKVYDLLNERKELQIRESKKEGFFIQNVEKKYVVHADEMIKLYKEGCKNRKTASTAMNSRSSRSHMVLLLGVTKYDRLDEKKKISLFNLVDLAGSEKFDVSNDNKETNNINTSLSTLGLVIQRLVEAASSKKRNTLSPPYRDSVLTRILKQSLGGNCKTSVIICCSPAKCNKDETLSSLRFGENCKKITNTVKQNVEKSKLELKAEIERLKAEISKAAVMKGDEEKRDEMINNYEEQIHSRDEEITKKNAAIKERDERIKELEDENDELMKGAEKEQLENQISELNTYIEELRKTLDESEERVSNLNGKLKTNGDSLKEKEEEINKLKAEINNNKSKYVTEKDELLEKIEELNNKNKLLNEERVDIEKMYQEKIMKIQNELSINNLKDILTKSQLRSLDESIINSISKEEIENMEDNEKETDSIVERIQKIMNYNKETIQNNLKEIEKLNEEIRDLNESLKNKEFDYITSKAEIESRLSEEISRINIDHKNKEKSLQEENFSLKSQLSYYKQNYERAVADKESTSKVLNQKLNVLKKMFRTRNVQDISKSEPPAKSNIPPLPKMKETPKESDEDIFIPPVIRRNMARLNKENEKLKDEINSVYDEKEQNDKQIEELMKEKYELERKLENVLKDMDKKETEILELKSLLVKYGEISKEAFNSLTESVIQNISCDNSEKNESEYGIMKMKNAIEVLSLKNKEKDEEISKLKDDLINTSNKYEELKDKNNEFNNQTKAFQSNLSESVRKELTPLNSSTINNDNGSNNSKILEVLNKKYVDEKNRIAELDKQIEALKKENRELHQTVEEKTKAINEALAFANTETNSLSDSVVSSLPKNEGNRNDIRMIVGMQQQIIDVLNKKYEDKESKIIELENTLRDLREIIFNNQSMSLTTDLSKSITREINIVDSDNIVEKVKLQHDTMILLNKKYEDKKSHIEELEKSIKELLAKYNKLNDDNNLLKINYSDIKKQKEELNNRYTFIKEEKKRIAAENDNLKEKINVKEKELSEIKQTLFNCPSNDSSKMLSESVMNILPPLQGGEGDNSITSNIRLMKETIDVLDDKNKEKKEEINKLKTNLDKIDKQHEEEKNSLIVQINNLQNNNKIYQQQYYNASNEINNLRQVQVEYSKLQSDKNKMISEYNQLKSNFEEIQSQYSRLKNYYEKLTSDYNTLNIYYTNVKNIVSQKDEMIKKQNDDKENEINNMKRHMNEELSKKDKMIRELEERIMEVRKKLENERDREKAFIQANYMERYNKLSQENIQLKQDKEKYQRSYENLLSELEIIQRTIDELKSNGLISKEIYEKLSKAYNNLNENYYDMISRLGFDFEHFNLQRYLNGDISLFTGHPHPLQLKGERQIRFMKESLELECRIYFPSSIESNLFTPQLIENVFDGDDGNKRIVHQVIELFLSIIGFKLEDKMIIRMDNTLETENKMFNLLEFEYQTAITQILRHLRETLQSKTQMAILQGLVAEINSNGPLNSRIVKQAYHDCWVNLYKYLLY